MFSYNGYDKTFKTEALEELYQRTVLQNDQEKLALEQKKGSAMLVLSWVLDALGISTHQSLRRQNISLNDIKGNYTYLVVQAVLEYFGEIREYDPRRRVKEPSLIRVIISKEIDSEEELGEISELIMESLSERYFDKWPSRTQVCIRHNPSLRPAPIIHVGIDYEEIDLLIQSGEIENSQRTFRSR